MGGFPATRTCRLQPSKCTQLFISCPRLSSYWRMPSQVIKIQENPRIFLLFTLALPLLICALGCVCSNHKLWGSPDNIKHNIGVAVARDKRPKQPTVCVVRRVGHRLRVVLSDQKPAFTSLQIISTAFSANAYTAVRIFPLGMTGITLASQIRTLVVPYTLS